MVSSKGYLFGIIGVACFSLTLPATRFAVEDIDPTIVGLGRALVAALFAGIMLLLHREKIPPRKHWLNIALVAAGAVVGFPVLTSIAMTHTHASHGAIVLGILPIATACFAVLIGRERPSLAFWLASLIGAALVIGYTVSESKGSFAFYDIVLLFAVFSAGLAYALGARIAREIGSWQVICWALLLSAPFLLPVVSYQVVHKGFEPKLPSLLGFLYVSAVSMFLGFFAWYKGLAIGGTAKVGMLQLLQPFMTLFFSALLLGETINTNAIIVAFAATSAIFFALKSRVKTNSFSLQTSKV